MEPSVDRLALLYRVTQTFNSSLDLSSVLDTVMDEVVSAMHAERGFLMMYNASKELIFQVARGIDHQLIMSNEFQVSRQAVDYVAQHGQPLLSSNAQKDARLDGSQSVIILGLRSILCVPLKYKDNIQGVIYVDNRLAEGIFTTADLDFLVSIASNAAIAIENARLYQLAVEKGRLERELQVAREVQGSLLPQETPEYKGWQFAARWRPAHQVSGDYINIKMPPQRKCELHWILLCCAIREPQLHMMILRCL